MSCGCSSLVTLYLSLVLIPGTLSVTWQRKPENTTIAKGGDVKFFCNVNDRGGKSVIWSKGSKILFLGNTSMTDTPMPRYSIEGEFNLVITNVQEDDADTFSCTVQILGTATAVLNVLVQPGNPVIAVNDSRPTYIEGDFVSLTCRSTGANPAPTFLWRKHTATGVISVPTSFIHVEVSVIKGESSSQIIIPVDKDDHLSKYSCYVFNQINQKNPLNASKDISVYYAPRITFLPYTPYNILLGSSYELECKVDSNPPTSNIVWRKGGQTLATSGGKLPLNNVLKTHTGEYSCTATNVIVGSPKSTAKSIQVTVMYAPIVNVPQSRVVSQGMDTSLKCTVDAFPPATVRWEKVDSTLTWSSGPFMNLTNIQVSQMGNYSCIATNQLQLSGQLTREERRKKFTMLYVQYKPGDAFISPYSPVQVGQSFTLTCTVNDPGFPAPKFEWKKVETGTVLAEVSSVLDVNSASLQHIGNYSCTAHNDMGRGGSSVMSVDIYEPPSFREFPRAQYIINRNNTGYTMTCKVGGRPRPRIYWYKDNKLISNYGDFYTVSTTLDMEGSYRYIVTSQLSLQGIGRPPTSRNNLLFEDMGNYSCLAVSNKTSTSEQKTTELLILMPPVTDKDQKVATIINDTASLSCQAQSYPIPQFQWYKGPALITPGGRISLDPIKFDGVYKATSVLKIAKVEHSDFADYRCIVMNGQGQGEKKITLVVKGKPEAPTDLSIKSKTWESVFLTWIPGFDGGEKQTFYVRYTTLPHSAHGPIDINAGEGNQLNVTGLLPQTMYEFRVVGINHIGESNHSAALKVPTEVLAFPAIKTIPVFQVEDKVLNIDIKVNSTYCLRIKYSRDNGRSWSSVTVKNIDCFDVTQRSYAIQEDGINRLNISLCLKSRQQVCGSHVSAEIKQQTSPDLTETEVIAIGCVCAAILIVLLCVLIYIICRRRQRNAKENKALANRQPQPVNGAGIPPAKPRRGIDNPDHGQNPSIYNLQHNNQNGYAPNGSIPLDTSYDSQLEKRLYENEMNRRNANMNNEYNNARQQGDMSPRKDPQHFLDLQPEEKKGEMGSLQSQESGYSTPDPAKPKKVIYEVVV